MFLSMKYFCLPQVIQDTLYLFIILLVQNMVVLQVQTIHSTFSHYFFPNSLLFSGSFTVYYYSAFCPLVLSLQAFKKLIQKYNINLSKRDSLIQFLVLLYNKDILLNWLLNQLYSYGKKFCIITIKIKYSFLS